LNVDIIWGESRRKGKEERRKGGEDGWWCWWGESGVEMGFMGVYGKI
jgi:hypothetical protein